MMEDRLSQGGLCGLMLKGRWKVCASQSAWDKLMQCSMAIPNADEVSCKHNIRLHSLATHMHQQHVYVHIMCRWSMLTGIDDAQGPAAQTAVNIAQNATRTLCLRFVTVGPDGSGGAS